MISDVFATALTIAVPATITSIAAAWATIRQANRAAEKVVVQTEAAAVKLAEVTHAKASEISGKVDRNTELAEATRAELQVVHQDTNGNLSKINSQLDTALKTIDEQGKTIARLEKILSDDTSSGDTTT
jgi:predicted transglutaminase-like cysteine proteinase